MSLNKLSADLLLEIVEWVGTDTYGPKTNSIISGGNSHLSRLAPCSRRLNEVVAQVLSKTTRLRQTGTQATPAILKRLLERSDFAAQVTKFTGTTVSTAVPLDMSSYTEADFDHCYDVIDVSSKGVVDMIRVAKVRSGCWDALTSVLLLYLPNLEELEIVVNGSSRHLYTPGAIISAGHLQQNGPTYEHGIFSMKRLRSVAFKGFGGPTAIVRSDEVIRWLFIPSITDVSIEGMRYSRDRQPILYHNTTTLSLVSAQRDSNYIGLETFLQPFPRLQRLRYKEETRQFHTTGLPTLLPSGLTNVKYSLEELVVLNEYQWDPETPLNNRYRAMPSRIDSLADFVNLKSIVAYSSLLMKKNGETLLASDSLVDILPESLQRLEIKGCRRGVMEQIPEFVIRKPERLPNLGTIVLEYVISGPEADQDFLGYEKEIAEQLKMDCEKAGIDLVFDLR